jgi:glucokinase
MNKSRKNLESDLMIGLDIGGTKLLGLIIDAKANEFTRIQKPTPVSQEQIVERVLSILEELIKRSKLNGKEIKTIGIGVPGYVIPESGVIVAADNLHIKELPLKDIISDYFNIPTNVIHDVRAALLGEKIFGAGNGKDFFAYVNIGTGISVGLVLDGKIYNGAASRAGELGHIQIKDDGPVCPCGLSGCLEALASGPALVRRINESISNGRKSIITKLSSTDDVNISGKIIEKAATMGDSLALEVIDQAAEYLGRSIGMLINVLDLECIIIGGGLSSMLTSPIRNKLEKYILPIYKDEVKVLTAGLGTDAGAVGAAYASYMDYC